MFRTRVFVLEEMSNVAAALKLHFFPRVWRILLVNTESGALLFDERRTQREKERESFILRPSLSSIARISILVREKSASLFSSHRAGEINRTDRITSRRVNAYIYT